jgi:hypothetical protein
MLLLTMAQDSNFKLIVCDGPGYLRHDRYTDPPYGYEVHVRISHVQEDLESFITLANVERIPKVKVHGTVDYASKGFEDTTLGELSSILRRELRRWDIGYVRDISLDPRPNPELVMFRLPLPDDEKETGSIIERIKQITIDMYNDYCKFDDE